MTNPHANENGVILWGCMTYLPKPKHYHRNVVVMCYVCGEQFYGWRSAHGTIHWRSIKVKED